MPLRILGATFLGLNPYAGLSADRVVRDALRQPLKPGRRYSNLGAAVLGNALATHNGITYAELLHRTVLDPLGLAATGFARTARGWTWIGRRRLPWVLTGYAPAGGITSCLGDMRSLLEALLDGTAPGIAALEPVDAGYGRFWLIDESGRRWHNGQTGGYSSYLAFDPARGRGVCVLADVADSSALQRLATALLPPS